jgi:hypothetical protein
VRAVKSGPSASRRDIHAVDFQGRPAATDLVLHEATAELIRRGQSRGISRIELTNLDNTVPKRRE